MQQFDTILAISVLKLHILYTHKLNIKIHMNCIEADNIIYIDHPITRKIHMSDTLMSKVTELENELKQYKDGVNSLSAQLEAHKQMLNESLNTILQLRTNVLLVQKHLSETIGKSQQVEKELKEKLALCEEKCATETDEVAA